MKLNKKKLQELLAGLKARPGRELLPELEDRIADQYGVLNDNNNQIDWLEFIINNYTK
jgi:hypothetical protein